MTRFAGACVALVLCGCAARGPSPQTVAELGKADTLLREGCYTCLKEAQAIFERLSMPPGPAPGAAQGAFDATLLVAMREKELGIPADASMARARDYATRLGTRDEVVSTTERVASTMPPKVLLDAAALVIGETGGLDPEQRAQLTGRGRPALDPANTERRALDAFVGTSLVAQYVALTIDCEQTRLRESVDPTAVLARYEGVPLIRFRVATCPRGGVPLAASVREADSRFADTLPWEARRAMVGSPTEAIDLYHAATLLGDARAAFPSSSWITLTWARTKQSLAEFEESLTGFDRVLGESSTHRDAMLGRVTSLSYLMRHQDAIATATRMIELGTWHMGDAHYWRAWNRYNLKDLEPAWSDVEEAIKLLSNTNVYMLAGLIAYDRKDLPTAILRFDRAFEIDGSNCDATWMSGLVHVDRQEWTPASARFSRGMSCFVGAASQARRDLANLDAEVKRSGGSLNPPGREARQRSKLNKDLDVAEERAAQSAFNAAQGFARTGRKSPALTHVDFAITYPRMKEKAEALKSAIEKMP